MITGAGAHVPNGGRPANVLDGVYDKPTSASQREAARRKFGIPTAPADDAYLVRAFIAVVQMLGLFTEPTRLMTLNIDGWSRQAGVAMENLIELHGCVRDGVCPACQIVRQDAFLIRTAKRPRCQACPAREELEIDVTMAGSDEEPDTWRTILHEPDKLISWLQEEREIVVIGVSDYTESLSALLAEFTRRDARIYVGNPASSSHAELTASLGPRTRFYSCLGALANDLMREYTEREEVERFFNLQERLDPARKADEPPRTREATRKGRN